MVSARQASPEPTGLRKFWRLLFAVANLLLGAMGLLVVVLYMLGPRQVGCLDYTGFSLFALPFSLGAIGVGHLRRSRLGYWTGYAGVLMMPVSFVVPPLNPGIAARIARNQASAVGYLRLLNDTEAAVESTYHKGYSPSLRSLGPPPEGSKLSSEAAGLIAAYLADDSRPAYRFKYSPGPRDANGRISTYTITASPVYANSGNFYFTDQTGVVRVNSSRPATVADPPLIG